MNASDVMSSYVVTTNSGACVQDVAKIMIENRISGAVVTNRCVDWIISEGG
jgi:CBS domain-containing protein